MVGAWTTSAKPLKATIPIWVPAPCRCTNDSAACSAASRRLGTMSVEHMLPETSIARMIEVRLVGTSTATGRANATMRSGQGDHEERERQMAAQP